MEKAEIMRNIGMLPIAMAEKRGLIQLKAYFPLGDMGERIKQNRKTRNLSQEEIANEIGISRTILSKIENGKEKVLPENWILIYQWLTLFDKEGR